MSFGEGAEKLNEAGLQVIPLRPREKIPIKTGWSKYSNEPVNPTEFTAWVNEYPDANIGLVLGPCSGIIVVDIDDSSLIDKFQKSPVSWQGQPGRESRAFKYNGESTKHWKGWDLLSTGAQVVIPDSIHPKTGKPYKYLSGKLPYSGELPVFDSAGHKHLEVPIERTFAAPGESITSGRHVTLRDLAWAMACDGKEFDEIVEALMSHDAANWFSDPEEPHKGTNPKNAACKMARKAIDKAISEHRTVPETKIDVDAICKPRPVIEEVPEPKAPRARDFYEKPPLPPEGAMRWIYDHIENQERPEIYSLSLAGALAIMSSLVQSRFHVGPFSAHLYVMGIAPSAVGKNFPKNFAEDLFTQMGTLGAGGYSSGGMIVRELHKQRERIDVIDEIAEMFNHMKTGSSFQAGMVDTYCKLFSCGPGRFFRFTQSMTSMKESGGRMGVWSPAVSILGFTTREGLLKSVSESMTLKGFFPRFLILEQPLLRLKERIDTTDYLTGILEWKAKFVADYPILKAKFDGPQNMQGSYTEPEDVPRLSRDVKLHDPDLLYHLKEKYFHEREEHYEDTSFDAFYGRKLEQILKVALCYELGRYQGPPIQHEFRKNGFGTQECCAINFTIKTDAIEYAEKLWNWMFLGYQRMLVNVLAEGSEKMQVSHNIEATIKQYGKGGCPQHVITRKFQRVSRREREEIIADLIGGHQIYREKRTTTGREATVYVHKINMIFK